MDSNEGKGGVEAAGQEANGCPTPPPPKKVTDLHVCVGLNSCQGQDPPGTAPMAGMGICATAQHICHGENACRGQGACGYVGTPAQQATPGENPCRGFGSCASPINAGRVSSAGVNKGKSLWRLARQLFEKRMYDAGIPFGPAPKEGVPDDEVPEWAGCGSKS